MANRLIFKGLKSVLYTFLLPGLSLMISCKPSVKPVQQLSPQVQADTFEKENIEKTAIDTSVEENKEIPVEKPDYDTSIWMEIKEDSSIILDLRYATEDNFLEEKLYDCPRCFLKKRVGQAILKIRDQLHDRGVGVVLFDCYRPHSVQKKLWEKLPDRRYVTDPAKGSMHNRGAAADISLFDLKTGKVLDMGTSFDFFGRRAYHTFQDLPEEVLQNRLMLKGTMEAAGFKSIRTEWWHYSFKLQQYGIAEMEWECK